MTKKTAIRMLGLTLALLGGATLAQAGSDEAEHGSSVRNNTEVQIINPDAGKDEPSATTLDGPKAENVIEDYRKEQQEAETGGLIEGMGE